MEPSYANATKVITQNLSIMFVDMEGFTDHTSNHSREGIEQLLELHTETIKPLFEKFEGTLIKIIGDAFLAVFHSPTNAVLCGLKIQEEVNKTKSEHPEMDQYRVRVVINSGEVHLRDGDVYGEPVNIASRIENIAHAGEIWLTEAVYLAMNKNEVEVSSLGEFELKGIPYKVELFKVEKLIEPELEIHDPAETEELHAGEATIFRTRSHPLQMQKPIQLVAYAVVALVITAIGILGTSKYSSAIYARVFSPVYAAVNHK